MRLLGAIILLAIPLHAELLTVDLAGVAIYEIDNPSLVQRTASLPPGSLITGLGYEVNLMIHDAMPAENLDVVVSSSVADGADVWFFAPEAGAGPGTFSASSEGVLSLASLPFAIGTGKETGLIEFPRGQLTLTFYAVKTQGIPNQLHATFAAGSRLTVEYHAPESRAPVIRFPKSTQLSSRRVRYVLKGWARDSTGISHVEVRAGSKRYRKARGTRRWRFSTRLKPGKNLFRVRAVDLFGNKSRTIRAIIVLY